MTASCTMKATGSVFYVMLVCYVVEGMIRKPHPCPITPRTDGYRPGHLEQFGCQRPPLGEVQEYFEPPTPRELWENHVKPYKPAVIRNALKGSPALSKWISDGYLVEAYGDQEVLIEKKYEDRKSEPKRMAIKEFLENYKTQNWYVVSMLPNAMRKDILLPRPLMCSTFKKNLAELNLWIGANGTRSMLHYDADNIIHCVVTGLKDWILVHPDNKPKLDMVLNRESQMSGFSHLNVDSIDENENPEVWDATWHYVTLKDGDCIYLPYQYLHQVRSYDRTISATFLFYPDANFDDENCQNVNFREPQNLKDAHVHWTFEQGQETHDMGYMNPEATRVSIIETMELSMKPQIDLQEFVYLMSVQHGIPQPEVLENVMDFFYELDDDENGFVNVDNVKMAEVEAIKRYCRGIESPHGPTKSQAPLDAKLTAKSPEFNPRRKDIHMDSRYAVVFLNFVVRVKGDKGRIVYPEFKKYVEIKDGSIADAFIMFDKNFDGILTQTEVRNATKPRLRQFSRMGYSLKGTSIQGGGFYDHEIAQNDLMYLRNMKEVPENKLLKPGESAEQLSAAQLLSKELVLFFNKLETSLTAQGSYDFTKLEKLIKSTGITSKHQPFDYKIFHKFLDRGNDGLVSLEDVRYFIKNEPVQYDDTEIKPCEFLALVVLEMSNIRHLEDELRQMEMDEQQENEHNVKTEL